MYGGKHYLFEGIERPQWSSSTAQTNNQARQASSVGYPAARPSRLPERNVREHAQSLRNYPATSTVSVTPNIYRTNSQPVNPSSTYHDFQTLHSYGRYVAPPNEPADQNSLGTEYTSPQPGPSSGAWDSSYEDAPQLNRHYASSASSHHNLAEPAQHPPRRSTEYNGDAGNSAYLAQTSNTLYNLDNERSRGYGANETSTLNQAQGPAWNNDGYRGSLAQSRWNFDSSRPGGPRHMSEGLVSPWSRSQEPDYSPQGRESAHQDEYVASETIHGEYHPANALPTVQSSPEQGGYLDLSQNVSSMQLAPQNTGYSNGAWEDGYSSASRDTTSSGSVSWKDRTSFSSVSDDYRAYPIDLPSQNVNPTGIDLARSYRNYKENKFQCDVHVWQRDERRNPKQLQFITLLFDTQCRESNWVAQKIVDDLGATVEEFSPPAKFIGFNGHPMITSRKTRLSFKNSHGGSYHETTFLVSAVEKIPFDMVLGAEDCLKFKIIEFPGLLGLAGPVERKGDKQANAAAAERHAEEKRQVAYEAQKIKDKKKREEKKKEEQRRKEDHKEKKEEERRKDDHKRKTEEERKGGHRSERRSSRR